MKATILDTHGRLNTLMTSYVLLFQVHPHFMADDESLEYIESLLIKLLAMMTAKPAPSSVSDIEASIFVVLQNF